MRIQTPSRLHFGLLVPGTGWRRRFGGLGLALAEPGWVIEAERAAAWKITGAAAERAAVWVERLRHRPDLAHTPPLHLHIVQAIPEHVGLGSGTQLALALAWLMARHAGMLPSLERLQLWTGRGQRSGIGIAAFAGGGFILDLGRLPDTDRPAPFLRLAFPAEWQIALVLPEVPIGLHGDKEAEVFAQFAGQANTASERLCRLALLHILPALLEHRYDDFAEGLFEYNRLAGQCFAHWQQGPYHSELVARLIEEFRQLGVPAAGQSSWGPCVFAISPKERLQPAVDEIAHRYRSLLRTIMITTAARAGVLSATALE